MTQATDLIDLLLARRRAAAQPGSPRFSVDQLLAGLPPPAPRPAPAPMSRWRALRSLWWQHWEPRPRDQRGLHWLGLIGSALIHGGLLVLLLWLAIVSWAIQQLEPEPDRTQVSFIGRATPDQEEGGGGAEAASGAASATAAPAKGASARRARPPAAGAQSPSAQAKPRPVAAPSPSSPAADAVAMPPLPPLPPAAASTSPPQPPPTPAQPDPKPLQATQAEVASTDFVVPPPSWLQLPEQPAPEVAAPAVRERVVEPVTARPRVAMPAPVVRAAPTLPERDMQVREREVAVVEAPALRPLPSPSLPATTPVAAPEPGVREREIADVAEPDPAQAPAEIQASAPSFPQPSVAVSAPPAQAQAPAPGSGAQRSVDMPRPTTGAGPGAGPKPVDRSGGWESPQRGDDWSVGQRQQAGSPQAGQGLYNRDGSARLGEAGQAPAERGAPGGDTDNWSREQIAQSGTWLKRPPYDYTPTSFDKYWVPNQSLLEEWVRKGIKKIEIAIPGTSTRISCVVSMLQFGGGCGLTDPNMNEQPAGARPPPDIPFKKELQEDNGSAR